MRKKLVAFAVGATSMALVLAGCGSGESNAEDFPDKDITMVITYGAGGATDASGRAIANALEDILGVTVVVENVDGASGTVGTTRVANSDADGYTIAMTTSSAISRVPVMQELEYTLDDLQPLALAADGAAVTLVSKDSPYETAEEFFEAAEAGDVTVATSGAQTPQGVELQRLAADHDMSFQNIPFAGDSEVVNAVVGGNADAGFTSNSDLVMNYIDDGAVRPIVFSEEERAEYLPDTPTFTELGYEDLTHSGTDFTIVGPAGLPENVITTYEEALEEALEEQTVIDTFGVNGTPDEFVGSAELTERLNSELEILTPALEQVSQ